MTLLPSLALLANMTFDGAQLSADWWPSPRRMAMIQIAVFWTEWYGTVIYAWAFVRDGKHTDNGVLNTALFVALTNGFWAILPLLGLYCMSQVVEENSMALFRQ